MPESTPRKLFRILIWSVSAALLLLLLIPAVWAKQITNFSFIHASDVHAPSTKSKEVIGRIKLLNEIDMSAFGIKAPKPEFAIVTGDLTEFGGGSGWWEEFRSYWNDCGIPVYYQLGNHDNTWHALVKHLRELYLAPCYSFNWKGCHFIGIMSATIQDPRPSIGEEQINWLKQDLAKLDLETPVFVFLHHPIGGTEFASRFDYDRLLDVLRERNTVLLMAGHSHGFVYRPFEDFDQVTGGSTFGPKPGLTFVYVCDNTIKVAYQNDGEQSASVKIFEKPIPSTNPFPKTEIVSPKLHDTVGSELKILACTDAKENVEKAICTIDDQIQVDLEVTRAENQWEAKGTADLTGLLPGAHYLRVEFVAGDRRFKRSTEFFYETADKPTAWRVYLEASSKCTPTVSDGVVYVGTNDGRLWAIDSKTGKKLWTVETGAEILAQPLVINERVIVANGLGLVQAYNTKGEKIWEFSTGEAVYSSPVHIDGGNIACGCNNGKLYIVNSKDGSLIATNEDATYSIESKPFAINGQIYFGAWDQYVRCVDAKTGNLIWKQLGEGSRTKESEGVRRYYSPADAGPVVAGGKVFIADRDYMLTILNANTGERLDAKAGVAATGLSEDGRFVYLRRTNGNLEKIDSNGNILWSTQCKMGYIPAAPAEKNGVVYVASGLGLVSAISASNGEIIWQYQASPQLFVMSSVVSDGERAYVTSFDGMLTAIWCNRKR